GLRPLQADARAERLEAQERPGPQEAVAAVAFAADDALEQKRPIALLNLAEGADGREGVADQLAVDRHEAVPPRQLRELLRGRVVTLHDRCQTSVSAGRGLPRHYSEKRAARRRPGHRPPHNAQTSKNPGLAFLISISSTPHFSYVTFF